MKKWMVLALIGGVVYWLTREPTPPRARTYVANDEHDLDPDDEEELLDEALEESFPASDPPAVTAHKH